MNRIALGLIALLLVAACASPAEIARQNAQADMAQCEALGLKPGTPEFTECHIRLAELRIQQRHAEVAEFEAATGFSAVIGNTLRGAHRQPLSRSMTCYPMGNGILDCR